MVIILLSVMMVGSITENSTETLNVTGNTTETLTVIGNLTYIFTAESNWTKYENRPIISKNTSNDWEHDGVYVPRIIKYLNGTAYQDKDGKYLMMYAGAKISIPGSMDQMGIAYSYDLYSWTTESKPVLQLGESFDRGDLVVITVVVDDNGIFHAWYEANSN